MIKKKNRYAVIIEQIFQEKFKPGDQEVYFERDDIIRVAKKKDIKIPKNLGDLIYTFRYRVRLPDSILEKSPRGKEWIIRPAGPAKYCFFACSFAEILPNNMMIEIMIPDSTPGIISLYSMSDEQALLAKLRYNKLVDIFSGLTCYSLQNHLRTTVPNLGQIETDEIYIGIDKSGIHYVLPVQAKGGSDKLSVVQIEQDIAMCRSKFPALIHRPIAAQFMANNVIALFELAEEKQDIKIVAEKHFRLVPPEEVTPELLESYKKRIS